METPVLFIVILCAWTGLMLGRAVYRTLRVLGVFKY